MIMLKYSTQLILFCILCLVANQAYAVEYYCEVTKKVDSENDYSTEMIKRFKFANKLEEIGNKAFISRCSILSGEGEETCDRIEVDHIERSSVIIPGTTLKKYFVKYYYYRGQLDFQIFPDLSFVENNGRGGIQYGKCRITSP